MKKTKFNTLFLDIQLYMKDSYVLYNIGLFDNLINLIEQLLEKNKMLENFSFEVKYNTTNIEVLATKLTIKIVITDPAFTYPKVLPFNRDLLNIINLIQARLDLVLR